MKAIATFALLGLAYSSHDDEFLVRPVHVSKKPHHEQERVPEMSKPLPPHPMETTHHSHDNQYLVRPVHVPKKPHHDKHEQHEKIPEMSNPLPPPSMENSDHTQDNEFMVHTHWEPKNIHERIRNIPQIPHSLPHFDDNELAKFPPGFPRPSQQNQEHPRPKGYFYDDEEDNELSVVIKPAIYYPPKQTPRVISCEDDELVQFVDATNELLLVEKLKKEALIAAKELKKTHAVVELLKALKEVVEEDDHDDNLANLGEIIRDGIKMHNDAMKKAANQVKNVEDWILNKKRHV